MQNSKKIPGVNPRKPVSGKGKWKLPPLEIMFGSAPEFCL